MIKTLVSALVALTSLALFSSCEKLSKTEEVIGNQIPYYDEVPTVLVENYLNRMYIDLIGREPLDSEMVADVAYLRSQDLSFASRETIALRLQTDTTSREGEGSYKIAYYHWFYERMKSDLLESADSIDFSVPLSDLQHQADIDSLNGDSVAFAKSKKALNKLKIVITCEHLYRDGKITFGDMAGYMVNNVLYDKINMQTFNFINATFDNLFYRFPTQNEFAAAFDMIEYSKPALLFGKSAASKDEYVDLLTHSKEFYSGMIQRGYLKLMVRVPSSAESAKAMATLYYDNNYQKFQRQLIITDEYAQFKPSYR